MKRAAVNYVMTVFLVLAAFLPSCALFFGGGEDDGGHKSAAMQFADPPEPYRRINVTSADAVWQSTRTGNTIAVNSLCSKAEKRDLQSLNSNILSGVEKLEVKKQSPFHYNGEDAFRTMASGETEGIPIAVDVVTFRKNDCTYDLAYVARQKTFASEHRDFNQFITGFKVP